MNSFGLPDSPLYDVQWFTGNSSAEGVGWAVWRKPKGRSMCSIFTLGAGGPGGNGVVGANSSAAGGGGGASGSQTHSIIPLAFLPGELYICVPMAPSGAQSANFFQTFVSISPDITVNHCIAAANNGGSGGNASTGTGGSAGTAGQVTSAATMPLGWQFVTQALAGQAGIAGGAAVSGAALTIPVTGGRTTGGTGGGGLPAAGATGTSGGAFTVPASPTLFPPQIGGVGSATATNPADNGSNGYQVTPAGLYFYGGTGGASTHGTATGGGLVGSKGGSGGYGCGGGGGGGALTASSQGIGGNGGSGLVIITCW